MRTRQASGIPAPFLDMAMGVIFVFLAVIMISTVDEPKKSVTEAPVPKAEFLVQLSWDDNSQDDIDLYVRSPDKNVVYFSRRQTPLMFLDADNLGLNNALDMPDGSISQVPTRREVVTVRAIMPGEYVVNSHFYKKNSPPGTVDHLVMTVTKLNPFAEVTRAETVLDTQGQEQTLANFTVEPDGKVTSVFLAPVALVGSNAT
jgi:hypothetical protein